MQSLEILCFLDYNSQNHLASMASGSYSFKMLHFQDMSVDGSGVDLEQGLAMAIQCGTGMG